MILATLLGCTGSGTDGGAGAEADSSSNAGQAAMVSDDGAGSAATNEGMPMSGDGSGGSDSGAASGQSSDASMEQCMLLDGVYTMSFELLSGECGQIDPHFVQLGASRAGIRPNTMVRSQDTLTTEVIDRRCSFRVIVTVTSRETGLITSIMDSELEVVGPEELSGTVERTEFDGSLAMTCQGTYGTIAIRS